MEFGDLKVRLSGINFSAICLLKTFFLEWTEKLLLLSCSSRGMPTKRWFLFKNKISNINIY
jgi:hypothetical protein